MSKGLVALVNPNKVYPPIAPYALDILATSLESAGFEAEVIDLTFCRDDWMPVLAEYFRARDPLLVGVTIRNTDTLYALEHRTFVLEHEEIISEVRRQTSAPVILGGVGFSTMPFALMEYFGADFGVKGPGEVILANLAEALVAGRLPETVEGLLIRQGTGVTRRIRSSRAGSLPLMRNAGYGEDRVWQVQGTGAYIRRSGTPLKVDNGEYYRRGGMVGVITKNGCPYRCNYCVEPNAKGVGFARRDVSAVVDEMESLTDQGIYDQHTTDSEFNLSIVNSKNLLREIVRRKDADPSSSLWQLRLWTYCQPAPFDEEFAELLALAGCRGVNVSADHVRTDLLAQWKATGRQSLWHTFDDTRRLVELCQKHGIMTMVEAMLGLPSETLDTMRECVAGFMALDATVVGFSLGIRLFPYSPLGIELAGVCGGVRSAPGIQSNATLDPIILKPYEKCDGPAEYERQFLFDEVGRVRLLGYLSPDLPRGSGSEVDPREQWRRSVEFLWECVPALEHYRVMLPTFAGVSQYDNNYADSPLLTTIVSLGHRGAFWSHWRDRQKIIRRAVETGVLDERAGNELLGVAAPVAPVVGRGEDGGTTPVDASFTLPTLENVATDVASSEVAGQIDRPSG